MVLDDKYILVIYTDSPLSMTRGKVARVNDLSEIIYEILIKNDIGVKQLPELDPNEEPEDETLKETLMQESEQTSKFIKLMDMGQKGDRLKLIFLKKVKEKFNKVFNNKIETNISPIKNYCKAEEYHQKYIEKTRR